MPGVECVTLDVKQRILEHLQSYPSAMMNALNILEISLNVDGLPLFKSNNHALLPVLCSVNFNPVSVFPLSLAVALSKLTFLDFISDTVHDLGNVIETGTVSEGKTLAVQLVRIICDAPVKAMIKCIKQYSGYFSCRRCTQRGGWLGRMTYQKVTNLTLWTNLTFGEQTQPEHHQEGKICPFCNLPGDVISCLTIDYLHQCKT